MDSSRSSSRRRRTVKRRSRIWKSRMSYSADTRTKDERMDDKQCVGVIGLGKIGGGLATNLLKAGFAVSVLDLDESRMQRVTTLGAQPLETPAAMAERCSVVFLSLYNGETVERVLFGESGLATAPHVSGVTVVDTTTVAPEESRAFARRLKELSV
ncbi:MAG: hypothetical protein GF331_27465, partial [Chitinivibrionales bacterium]|nr:hypothetical protein [Chitinivibrionales bacterium]